VVAILRVLLELVKRVVQEVAGLITGTPQAARQVLRVKVMRGELVLELQQIVALAVVAALVRLVETEQEVAVELAVLEVMV
jgi:predicted transcriptional regulator